MTFLPLPIERTVNWAERMGRWAHFVKLKRGSRYGRSGQWDAAYPP